jgi:hypothetical protein
MSGQNQSNDLKRVGTDPLLRHVTNLCTLSIHKVRVRTIFLQTVEAVYRVG